MVQSPVRNYDIINAESKQKLSSNHSKVDIKNVINTGMFDFEKAEASAGWIKELENEHIPEMKNMELVHLYTEEKFLFITIGFLILYKTIFLKIF